MWLGPGQFVSEAESAPKRQASRMTDYGGVMTVRQLSDLVAFLCAAAEAQ